MPAHGHTHADTAGQRGLGARLIGPRFDAWLRLVTDEPRQLLVGNPAQCARDRAAKLGGAMIATPTMSDNYGPFFAHIQQ